MAQRFVDEATAQVAPIYQQQEQALKSQIPAIQQLYQTLFQGLEGQRATETQNILESAGARGVLRSSMPVDLQTQLGTALLAERSKLGAQQAQEIAGVNMKIGELGTQRLNAINQLADTLYNRDLNERKLQQEQEQARQQMALARASSRGGGGGGGRAPSKQEVYSQAAGALRAQLVADKLIGRDGYVSPQTYSQMRREWGAAGLVDFDRYFGGYKNPNNKNYR